MRSLLLEHTIKSYLLFIVAATKIVKKQELGIETEKKLLCRHRKIYAWGNSNESNTLEWKWMGTGDKYAKMQQSRHRQNKVIFIIVILFESDLK